MLEQPHAELCWHSPLPAAAAIAEAVAAVAADARRGAPAECGVTVQCSTFKLPCGMSLRRLPFLPGALEWKRVIGESVFMALVCAHSSVYHIACLHRRCQASIAFQGNNKLHTLST